MGVGWGVRAGVDDLTDWKSLAESIKHNPVSFSSLTDDETLKSPAHSRPTSLQTPKRGQKQDLFRVKRHAAVTIVNTSHHISIQPSAGAVGNQVALNNEQVRAARGKG